MNIRPKTVRRLLVLLAVAAVVVVAFLGIRAYKDAQRAARLQADREAGIAAFQSGDFPAALDRLKNYIRRDTSDFDALLAYATSRSKVELPNGRHLPEAIQWFEALRSLRPDDATVRRSLLDLYTQAGYGTEAITLADAVLAADPNDIDALRAKSIALSRAARFDEALSVSLRLNEAAPLDLDGHTQTYWLLRKTQAPPDRILARYRDLLAQHPDDPRFEMLLGIATGDNGDRDGALALLRSAAARTPPDAAFVAQLARIFDQQRLFDESQQILRRAAERADDPSVVLVLVQRLWQDGQYAQAADRLAALDPASPASDTQLLAWRALALLSLGRADEARAVIDALANRPNDNAAKGWVSALRTRIESTALPPATLIARYQAALSRGGDNGVVRFWLGEAYQQLGELDAAVRQWQQSAELMPSWAAPHVQVARVMLSRNRAADALDAAAAAVRCAPDQVAPLTTLALARYAMLQQSAAPSAQDQQRLAQVVAEIQRLKPGEPDTLPLHAALLCRAVRRDDAIAAIRAALPSAGDTWEPDTLANLLAVSREFDLKLEPELLQATRLSAQRSPRMALRHALEAIRAGEDPGAARATLETAARAAPAGIDALRWQMALAQLREATGDPAAAGTWIALGDAHPEDFAVQSLILRSAASARADRAFASRTIDRVRKLTGEDGTLWRLARARLLLSAGEDDPANQSASAANNAEAVGLLTELVRAAPNVPEYRVLLAQAMENLGNAREAAQQLQAAANIDPRSVSVQIELARLLGELGRAADARKHLELAASNPMIERSQRLPLAQLLADAGETARAIAVLEAGMNGGSPRGNPVGGATTTAADLPTERLLASLYRRVGRDADAGAVYDRLLRDLPTPTAELIADAADFYAASGDMDRARATLARLETLSLPPARRRTLLARFDERHGNIGDAIANLYAATEAAPGDPDVWRNLALAHVRLGQFDSAIAAIDRAVAANRREDAPPAANIGGELATLRLQVDAMRRMADDPTDLSPLIDVLATDPARAGEAAALRSMRDILATTRPTGPQLARLKQSADRFPQFLPLQRTLAAAYRAVGQNADALAVAYRLIDALPNDPAAGALAYSIFADQRQWAAALNAARQWRRGVRLSDQPAVRASDLAVAEALLRLNRPGEAIAQLTAHLPQAARSSASPADDGSAEAVTANGILRVSAEAMVAAGQPERADDLLGPILAQSPQARRIWLAIVADRLTPVTVARDWLARARAAIDPAAPSADDEAVEFARAAIAAATRLNAPELLDDADDVLAPHVAPTLDSPDPQALFAAGAVALRQDRPTDAIGFLQAALRKTPDDPAVANDLAWSMLLTGTDLPTARTLATRATEARPDVATFHETLARIEAELGRTDAAITAFDRALRLEPGNIDALIGKAYVLRQAGDAAGARRLLGQVEPLLRGAPALLEPSRGQLQRLRDELTRGD